MKKQLWSLFWKFLLGISAIVLFFGLLNAIIVRNSVDRALQNEFERRGNFITKALAEQSAAYILSNDRAGLNMLINEMMAIDETIRYAFVVDGDGEILAHSFMEGVPDDLLLLNHPAEDEQIYTITVLDRGEENFFIRDFSTAVMSKSLGVARIGILENEIRDRVSLTIRSLWIMVFFFLILGLISAFFFSYTISKPLAVLSSHSKGVDIDNIRDGLQEIRKSETKPYYRIRHLFGLKDEIDILYENYVNMLKRLAEAYANMNRLQQSLLQSEKLAAIGTLTAGVTHEINNPLAGMTIALKRIRENRGSRDQIKKYITLMEEGLSRIEQVIQDLLTFSRKDDFSMVKTEVKALLENAVKLAQYRIKIQNIDIEVDDKFDGIYLHVAPNRIEQVFLNIIINAIDAISEKMKCENMARGLIRITFENQDPMPCILIEDNGAGMDQEQARKIFDPFFTTKDVGKGTGLGLSVSYQIVEEHGGHIDVESKPGEGTRFRIYLPKHDV